MKNQFTTNESTLLQFEDNIAMYQRMYMEL